MTGNVLRWTFGLILSGIAATAAADDTVKVALNIPLSGPFANGDLYVKHSQFAIEAINARGASWEAQVRASRPGTTRTARKKLSWLCSRSSTAGRVQDPERGSHVAVPLAQAGETQQPIPSSVCSFDEPGDYDLSQEKCNFGPSCSGTVNAEIKMEAMTNDIARQPNIKRVYRSTKTTSSGSRCRLPERCSHANVRTSRLGERLASIGQDQGFLLVRRQDPGRQRRYCDHGQLG
jgi:hypothetical protein